MDAVDLLERGDEVRLGDLAALEKYFPQHRELVLLFFQGALQRALGNLFPLAQKGAQLFRLDIVRPSLIWRVLGPAGYRRSSGPCNHLLFWHFRLTGTAKCRPHTDCTMSHGAGCG